MQIVEKSISELKPYEKNPRDNKPAVDYVANSIEKFGFKVPMVIDSNNVIVCGHTRYLAAKKLGIDKVPCVIADDLTPKQIKAFRLADNKVSEFATWDFELLDTELLDLQDLEIDMSDFGFTFDDEPQEEPQEDDFSDADMDNTTPKSQQGDLWLLGKHRLICGDCTKQENITLLMDGKKADMVFTDPPYGINLDTDGGAKKRKWEKSPAVSVSKTYEPVKNDSEYYDVTHIFRDFGCVKEIFLWGANYFANKLPNPEKSSWMVWDKTAGHSQEVIGSEFELCWSRQKHKQFILSYKWSGIMGLSQQDTKSRVHPTQKPLQVLTPIIMDYSKPDAVVVDLFGGSGSVLIACEQTGRTCNTIELDENYCDVIVSRYIKYTGSSKDVFLIRDGNKIAYNDL